MLAKFGLMHLIATNCCIWLRTLVKAVALLAHEKSGTFPFFVFAIVACICLAVPLVHVSRTTIIMKDCWYWAGTDTPLCTGVHERNHRDGWIWEARGRRWQPNNLKKIFWHFSGFFGCESIPMIPISLSQLVFCSIKNKIIEHKNHTESYSLEWSQNFPFPVHCQRQSKTGRDTSRQVKTNQAAFAVSSFYAGFLDNCKSMKDFKMFTFYV